MKLSTLTRTNESVIQRDLYNTKFESNYLNVLINLHLNQEVLAKLPQDLSFHSSSLSLRHCEKEKSKKRGIKIVNSLPIRSIIRTTDNCIS